MYASVKNWLIFVLATSGCLALKVSCPAEEDVAPCKCEDSADYIVVTCHNVPDTQTLLRPIQGLSGYLVDELWIEDSDLGDVPGTIFKGTHIATITFLDTNIKTLGDAKDLPFSGLEHILKGLTITEGFQDPRNPIVKPLKFHHLMKLENLVLESNIITKVDNSWFSDGYEALKSLYINDCDLEDVGDKAFSKLEQLSILDLSENNIRVLSRSMLPTRAQHLSVIWLRNNKIQSLPADIFTNLPNLDRLYLSSNELTTLPEDTWMTIFTQVSLLFVNGNPLVCDARIKWILTAKTPELFEAKCKEPASLAGKHISHLKEEDLLFLSRV